MTSFSILEVIDRPYYPLWLTLAHGSESSKSGVCGRAARNKTQTTNNKQPTTTTLTTDNRRELLLLQHQQLYANASSSTSPTASSHARHCYRQMRVMLPPIGGPLTALTFDTPHVSTTFYLRHTASHPLKIHKAMHEPSMI